jgi:hypothetical protein
MITYHFRFRDVPGRGSPQKYWHYLWDYLLPSVSFLINRELAGARYEPPVFDSFGPIMDGVLQDYMAILSQDYRILAAGEALAGDGIVNQFAARWDVLQFSMAGVYFRDLPIDPPPTRRERWRAGIQVLRQRKWDALTSGIDGRRLRKDLHVLRNFILDRLSAESSPDSPRSPFIVLERSTVATGEDGGNCRFLREYGTATKSLQGVSETVERLGSLGFDVERFEPGAVSQAEQIRRFSNARGVIAIRGSDLANLLWLKPGSRLIVLRPQKKLSTHLYGMARLLKLELQELACDDPYPNLARFPIECYLGSP